MQEKIARGAQYALGLRATHGRKLVQKRLQRLIVFEKLKEKLDRHARARKYGHSTHLFRVAFDQVLGFHGPFAPESAEAGVNASADSTWPRARRPRQISIYDFLKTLYDGTRL